VNRGEIWWVDLDAPGGAGPGYRRPLLVVQTDGFNRSLIATTICVVLTSNVRLAEAPGNVLIPARESRLHKDSVANVSQVVTVDKARLAERVGKLPPRFMRAVSEGLRLVLLVS
jgi:mRNA interferase MazF